ncbi:MAG TPA: WecB/TagA/CpsF family glycosyltransferase [Verrucomicrobiae bacterium]|nr:WecB/TagA/CpsF family glycosyltransferase [Verrucomicrobiae bacterium]
MNAPASDKVTLFGIPIDNLNMTEVLDRIEAMVKDGGIHQHVVVNVDKLVKMDTNPSLRQTVLDCDLITVDGQPVIWASRLFGCPIKERVTGVDLFDALMGRCAERGLHPYLLGARQEIVSKAVDVLKARYPRLEFAGWRNGYWKPEEEAGVVDEIKRVKPDVLCMAVGSPKQELFLGKWKKEMAVPFVMGVGGSFDVTAGVLKRAPKWVQRVGMEWLYRLAQEPRRLWRRYLRDDMGFFRLVWREWRRRRSTGVS